MKRKEYLQQRTADERISRWGLTRYPLAYRDSAKQDVNEQRLPDAEDMKNMELACQSDMPPSEDQSIADFIAILGTAAIAFAIISLVTILPLSTIFVVGYGTVVALMAAGFLAVKKLASKRFCFWLTLTPAIIKLASLLVDALSGNRFIFTLVVTACSILVLKTYGAMPLKFHREWLTSYPWLTIAQRRKFMQEQIPMEPDIPLLVAIFGLGFVGVYLSLTVTLLLVYALVIVRLVAKTPGRRFFLSRVQYYYQIFAHYLNHIPGLAAGIWRPRRDASGGRVKFALMAFVFYLALNVTLCVMGPWDALRFSSDFELEFEDVTELASDHYLWFMEAVYYIADLEIDGEDRARAGLLFLIALAVHLSLPVLSFVAIFTRPLERLIALENEILSLKGNDKRPEWQWYVDRLRPSMHEALDPTGDTVRESEHLFIGMENRARYPVLLDEKILSEHAYIVGETGSGKTSLGILPILMQLIGGHAQKVGSQSPVPPIVILDLKGDPALFHIVRSLTHQRAEQQAIENGVEAGDEEGLEAARKASFKFFTPEKGRASHVFNPFDNLQSESRSLIQLCNILLDSLSLNHGEGYGRSYYSQQSRLTLAKALTENPNLKSFQDLSETVLRVSKKDNIRDIFELLAVIYSLNHYPQLGAPAGVPENEVINMAEVVEKRQVVYFWLPAALESVSVREIGKLAVFSYFTALVDRQRSETDGSTPRQCYLVIDEFQRLAGHNFKIILEQARSFGLGAILANQAQSDLKTADTDLRPTIRTNTRLKMCFSVSDPLDMKDLIETSGQEIAFMESISDLGGQSQSQSIKNRINVNDVLEVNDSPVDMIFQAARGSGYTQFGGLPIVVRTTWPLLFEDYKAYASQPWPETSVELSQETPNEVDRKSQEEVQALLSKLGKKVDSMFPEL